MKKFKEYFEESNVTSYADIQNYLQGDLELKNITYKKNLRQSEGSIKVDGSLYPFGFKNESDNDGKLSFFISSSGWKGCKNLIEMKKEIIKYINSMKSVRK